MDWADDITYAVHDLVDFYCAGKIPLDRLADPNDGEREIFLSAVFKRKPKWTTRRPALQDAFVRLLELFPFDRRYEGTLEPSIPSFGPEGPILSSRASRSSVRRRIRRGRAYAREQLVDRDSLGGGDRGPTALELGFQIGSLYGRHLVDRVDHDPRELGALRQVRLAPDHYLTAFGGTADSTLTRRAFPNAKHSIVSCETNRNRSVIALADMSTIIRSPPGGA
jgi:hypothetical protein